MWIMTPFGILMPAALPDDLPNLDPTWDLQVRTRDKRALTYLRKQYMRNKLGPTIPTPQLDYDYRAYCDAEDFAAAVARMILEIDYEKFKPETERFGKMGHDLHVLYNRIWSVVFTHYERHTRTRKRWYEDINY